MVVCVPRRPLEDAYGVSGVRCEAEMLRSEKGPGEKYVARCCIYEGKDRPARFCMLALAGWVCLSHSEVYAGGSVGTLEKCVPHAYVLCHE